MYIQNIGNKTAALVFYIAADGDDICLECMSEGCDPFVPENQYTPRESITSGERIEEILDK